MRVFQASRLRDADKIHTCNFNQPDPLDAALEYAAGLSHPPRPARSMLSGCLLS